MHFHSLFHSLCTLLPPQIRDSDDGSRSVAQGIKNVFQDITTFKMPRPGSKVESGSASKGTIKVSGWC